MVQELKDAARDPVIQTALVQKISRDRVGEEMHKMMKGMKLSAIPFRNIDELCYRP